MNPNGNGRIHAVAVLLLLAICVGGCRGVETAEPTLATGPLPGSEANVNYEDAWKRVEKLEDDQKFEAASRAVAEIRAEAAAAGHEQTWTRSLIEETALRMALHGYETAVRFLKDEPWPEEPLYRAVLDLYYAESLRTYLSGYGFEIRGRERTVGTEEVDLKAWTQDQIVGELHAALLRTWSERGAWGDRVLGTLKDYIEPNDFPDRIRGTLRDAVTYLWVAKLSDTSLWRPEHSNDLHLLDRDALIRGDADPGAADALADNAVHPLRRLVAVLDDLQTWHLSRGEHEAAYECELRRLMALYAAFTGSEDKLAVRERLERVQNTVDDGLPWWSMGQYCLATMIRGEDTPDHLIRAHAAATAGLERHPDTPGGIYCDHKIATIEAPDYDVEAMDADACGEPSIRIRARNMEALHFRAWRVDVVERFESDRDLDVFPSRRHGESWTKNRTPDLEWTVALPQTCDYRDHATFTEMPDCPKGGYVVMASALEDFSREKNDVRVLGVIVTDLAVVPRFVDGGWEACVRSAVTGDPVAGAEATVRFRRRGQNERVLETRRTDEHGLADLPSARNTCELLARHGDDLAYAGHLYGRGDSERRRDTASFIYTDRSVYRPGQTLHWKVVAYEGGGDDFEFATLPERKLTLQLRDANGEMVAVEDVRTNSFGSASGSIVIPRDRLLGSWSLGSSLGGFASVSVEEYKRPTFETTLLDPEKPLRLNRPARLTGEARYYFGLPVNEGEASWRVTREPVFPRWWWWRRPPGGVQTVASGRSELAADGTFAVEFTPEADGRDEDERSITYTYRLSADVTDAGGETRSASRSFRLGFVSVAAHVAPDAEFGLAAEAWTARIRRTDLNGVPRPGAGRWTLAALRQPAAPVLPADEPIRFTEDDPYRTPGDARRTRWSTSVDLVRTLGSWEDGETVASGETVHGEDGGCAVSIADLAPGAYRLHYETEDDFGAVCRERVDFAVAGQGAASLAAPVALAARRSSARVGETLRLLVHSGLPEQSMMLEVFRDRKRILRRHLLSGRDGSVVEIPIEESHRGGFVVRLTALRDHQSMVVTRRVHVPWDDRELKIEFSSFRDELRPGEPETFRVTVRGLDDERIAAGAAEVLAYMYDRSLDVFATHRPPSASRLYPGLASATQIIAPGRTAPFLWRRHDGFGATRGLAMMHGDRLRRFSDHGIGGMGHRALMTRSSSYMVETAAPMDVADSLADYAIDSVEDAVAKQAGVQMREGELHVRGGRDGAVVTIAGDPSGAAEPVEPRADFSETAFFAPHLRLDEDGAATIEFKVPDSVTEWNVWAHALTRDLRGGSTTKTAASVKDLMVRPYLPRFLREGDRAELKIVVNNASERELSGALDFEIFDPDTEEDLRSEFGLTEATTTGLAFTVEAGGGTDLTVPIRTPARVGPTAVRVTARADDVGDGEQRPLPILPGRMHLMQSRFASLREGERRELRFDDLAADDDPTRIHEQLVVTVDAQLFYGVLSAVPYLVDYPYECSEQTLNRFLSTGILASLFDDYPSVAAMAKTFSERETRLETWEEDDPNRKLLLEETPWLQRARGGRDTGHDLIKVLDPRIAAATRDASLAKLRKMQNPDGGFPWWPGGRSSPYLTLYVLHGFAKGLEFDVDVPRDVIARSWRYLWSYYVDELAGEMIGKRHCWEEVTFLNYILSCYEGDAADWTDGVFDAESRERMLAYSFEHWREHAPYLKGYLALTLARADRRDDAMLVFDSVMDSARTDPDLGTYWAPEDRAWLWYNDTIETHAFALRVMTELTPDDPRREGLVQWLMLNKKLNHWSSTRATAEVVYALTHYLDSVGGLGERESVTVDVGPRHAEFVFEPDAYTGARNRILVPGPEIDPETMHTIMVEKGGAGTAFASATWHFSTEEPPARADGDLFGVTRRWYRRVHDGREWTLEPLGPGDAVAVGDQLEVQLDVRAKHAAEFVHLRDPRAAGFEPENATSGYRWDQGLARYEEVRDSGANFFFDWIPAGQYTLRYRLRATMAGTFKVAPATMQSMYAPEFAAHSAGGTALIE